jgi:hypothetical protein
MQLVLGMIQLTNSPLGVKQQSLTLSFSMFKVLLQPNIQKQALNLKVQTLCRSHFIFIKPLKVLTRILRSVYQRVYHIIILHQHRRRQFSMLDIIYLLP